MSGFRSSTSKTRSKLTSPTIAVDCIVDSWLIGPYTRSSSATIATSVPNSKVPLMASAPPSP